MLLFTQSPLFGNAPFGIAASWLQHAGPFISSRYLHTYNLNSDNRNLYALHETTSKNFVFEHLLAMETVATAIFWCISMFCIYLHLVPDSQDLPLRYYIFEKSTVYLGQVYKIFFLFLSQSSFSRLNLLKTKTIWSHNDFLLFPPSQKKSVPCHDWTSV